MERFPYMSGEQISTLLKTTATDLGAAGIDSLYGWGMINLGKAVSGPGMFITAEDIPAEFRIDGGYGSGQFVADLPGLGRWSMQANPPNVCATMCTAGGMCGATTFPVTAA